jgi:hypothetical protein
LGLALGVLAATIDGRNSGWLNHYQKADSHSHHLQKSPKTWILHYLYYKQQKDSKGVFSSPFIPKNSRFWSIILHNGTKHHAKFLAKRWLFPILDFSLKRPKKAQKRLGARAHPHQHQEKFGILDGTKHTHEKISILHFIILKYLAFCILHSMGN